MADEAKVARALALVAGGSGDAQEAVVIATQCIESGTKSVDAYVALTRALMLQRKGDDAVRWCKRGLDLHPSHEELEKTLRDARLLVLHTLLDDDDEEEEDKDALASSKETSAARFHGTSVVTTDAFESSPSAHQTGDRMSTALSDNRPSTAMSFDEKVERVLHYLDVTKLVRIGLGYVLMELVELRVVTAGFTALFLGLLVQAILHRQKLMVVSMLVVGLTHSRLRIQAEKYLQNWVHSSTDKLGAVTWLPRVAVALPIVLKVVGYLRFMLFLQSDLLLSLCVTCTSGLCVVASAWVCEETHPFKVWGYGKRLKFVAYATAIIFVVCWRQQYRNVLNLLGPALIDAGGILLGSVSSEDVRAVAQRAWKRLFNEVSADVQQEVAFDAWFFLGLSNWIVDYWQQPTDFSLEMLVKWLSDAFGSFEKSAVHLFRPELHRLRSQMNVLGHNEELTLLVEYLQRSLQQIPPRKWLGFAGLIAKQCASFVVATFLLVFHGTFAIALLPFLASEFVDARALWGLYDSDEMRPMDGLDVLLLGSPLSRVWQNAKAAVYHLEGGMVLSKAVATGAQVVTAATRLTQLARFAAKVKSAGLVAHADEIPDQVASAFAVLGDVGVISSGVQHVYESVHLQDLAQSVGRWWHGR